MTEAGGMTVVMDYCHNAHGMRMLGDFVDRWTADAHAGSRRVGVIATPGDRRDEDIRDLGRAAAPHFDHLVVPSRMSLRGRAVGEMAVLVREGIESAVADGVVRPVTEVVGDEPEAVAAAFAAAVPGDLVVICATDPALVWGLVQERRAPAT
jgi:cyanophycin synthetase